MGHLDVPASQHALHIGADCVQVSRLREVIAGLEMSLDFGGRHRRNDRAARDLRLDSFQRSAHGVKQHVLRDGHIRILPVPISS